MILNSTWLSKLFSAKQRRRRGIAPRDAAGAERLETRTLLAANFTQITDILPGAEDSDPRNFVVWNNNLYFSARHSDGGNPIYRYDGNDVALVSEPDVTVHDMVLHEGVLYFGGMRTGSAAELWRFDGASSTFVADIRPGSGGSSPKELVVFDGDLYFSADGGDGKGRELWKYDGIAASRVTDLVAGSGSSYPKGGVVYQDLLYFAGNDDVGPHIFRYDGTGVVAVADMQADDLAVYNGEIYFNGDLGSSNWELWKFDGTTASLAAELDPTGHGLPEALTVLDSELYFRTELGHPTHIEELWKFDGTDAEFIADLDVQTAPPEAFQYRSGSSMIAFRGNLYLDVDFQNGSGMELYELTLFDQTTVDLPLGGGTFEVLVDGSDLVVREQGGSDVLRQAAAAVQALTINGSSDGETIVVDYSGGDPAPVFGMLINAGDGDDTVGAVGSSPFSATTVVVDGENGNDLLDFSAMTSPVVLRGSDGNDTLRGGQSHDEIAGGPGNDWLNGHRGRDTLLGGEQADKIFGGGGGDLLVGDADNDTLRGHGGRDTLRGGDGDDIIVGGSGTDLLVEAGDVDFNLADDSLTGRGADVLSGVERVELTGGDGDNLLDARDFSGNVTLHGGQGADSLIGGSGDDSLYGGDGNDTLNGRSGNDRLFGSNGDDGLSGMAGNDKLYGGKGQDTVLGGDGDDTVQGQLNNDTVMGGPGADNVNGNLNDDTVAGGGNGVAADPNDTVNGETIDDGFMFDAPWVNV